MGISASGILYCIRISRIKQSCKEITYISVNIPIFRRHIFLIRNSDIYLLIQQNIVYFHPIRN